MRYKSLIILAIVACAAVLCGPNAGFASILLSADNFAVLAGSTVTNTGNTTINGDIGVFPLAAYTGAGTVTQTGSVYLGNAVAGTAQGDLTTAYNSVAGMPFGTQYLVPTDIGGLTLAPGVYHFNSSAGLTGTLSLDAGGFNNVSWFFQIGTALTTAPNSAVQFVNLGTNGGLDNGVFWQVGSQATLDTNTAFKGNILAGQSVVLNNGATLDGRALAKIAAVTMDNNTINSGNGGYNGVLLGPLGPSTIPEPSTMLLLGIGGVATAFMRKRRKT